jgi:hypothetical protein
MLVLIFLHSPAIRKAKLPHAEAAKAAEMKQPRLSFPNPFLLLILRGLAEGIPSGLRPLREAFFFCCFFF